MKSGLRLSLAVKRLMQLGLIFLSLGGGVASAVDFQLNSSSYFFFSKDWYVNNPNNFYAPYYQYLDVDISNLGSPALSLHISGWGRGDFTSRGAGENRGDGELLYGYVEWRSQSNSRRVLKVGRQFIFGGAGSIRSLYLDGLYFKSDIWKGLGVEIFAGSPVISAITGRGGDLVGQGRMYYVWENKAEVGVAYLNARDSWERSRENVGLDFWLSPVSKLELMGYLYYDIIGKEFSDANITTVIYPIDKLKINVDLGYTVPADLLPHTSLFTVFSMSNYLKAGIVTTYFLSDRLTLDADLQFFHYSDGGNLTRFGAEGSYRYGADKQGTVSLAAHRLDQLEGGVTELRVYNNYLFKNKISVALDLYGYLFDQAIRNRDFSFTAVGSLGYEILKNLKITGSLFYSDNPFFNNEFRGMLKTVYSFGG